MIQTTDPKAPATKSGTKGNKLPLPDRLVLSIEQLATWIIAMDKPKKGGPDERMDSQVKIAGQYAYACNQDKGMAFRVKRAVHPSDAGKRTFISYMPTQVARLCAEAWSRAGQAMECHLERCDNDVEQKFVMRDLDGNVEPVETIFSPIIERFRDVAGAFKKARNRPVKARVALDTAQLAKLVQARSKVGGHGPVMIEVRGELDEVWVGWKDGVGHEAEVLVSATQLSEDEWKATEKW